MSKYSYHNRDLSWLSFNYRVLMEAKDPSVPILERLRFIAIYSSNLDEFYRVRVANLRKVDRLGKKLKKDIGVKTGSILKEIHQQVNTQLDEFGRVLDEILELLGRKGVFIHRNNFEDHHREELERYFYSRVLGHLVPQFIGAKAPPFLKNKALYFGIKLYKDGEPKEAILNIPSNKIPRFYSINDADGKHYYFIDDIIRNHLDVLFPDYTIAECRSVKLNKDADLNIDDEYDGDLIAKIEKRIKKRDLGVPSRFLYDGNASTNFLNLLKDKLELCDEDLYSGGRYHNLNDFFQIDGSHVSDLEYCSQTPIRVKQIDESKSIFTSIDKQDRLLNFPYQSYDYVIRFFNEAAIHPDVSEINATFYRMAGNSLIGEALVSAAKNGKKVNVFMEVKARFDEENNLKWAERMRKRGST